MPTFSNWLNSTMKNKASCSEVDILYGCTGICMLKQRTCDNINLKKNNEEVF